MLVEQVLGERAITILDPDELDDDVFVIPTAQMGAPTVMVEKIPRRDRAGARAAHPRGAPGPQGRCDDADRVRRHQLDDPAGRRCRDGLPVVDADGMGRAFPELSMETFAVYGVHGSPLAHRRRARTRRVIIDTGDDDRQMEWLARGITIRLGGVAHIAEYPMTGAEVKRTAVPRTISMALALGRAIRLAREEHARPSKQSPKRSSIDAVLAPPGAVRGQDRGRRAPHDRGIRQGPAVISPLEPTAANELRSRSRTKTSSPAERRGRLAIVPDLICVVDAETAEPITTEGLRYGQRVRVLGISTPAMMRTPEALAAFGPAAFGLEERFVPVETAPVGATAPIASHHDQASPRASPASRRLPEDSPYLDPGAAGKPHFKNSSWKPPAPGR